MNKQFSDAFYDGIAGIPPRSTERAYLDDWAEGRISYGKFIGSKHDNLPEPEEEPPIVLVGSRRLEKIAGVVIVKAMIRKNAQTRRGQLFDLEPTPSETD